MCVCARVCMSARLSAPTEGSLVTTFTLEFQVSVCICVCVRVRCSFAMKCSVTITMVTDFCWCFLCHLTADWSTSFFPILMFPFLLPSLSFFLSAFLPFSLSLFLCILVVKCQPTGQVSSAVLINVFICQARSRSSGGHEFHCEPGASFSVRVSTFGMHLVALCPKTKLHSCWFVSVIVQSFEVYLNFKSLCNKP